VSAFRAIDITNQKKDEFHQARRVEDALEARRQSEHFIDMVSHELRNPMSAMLQSADVITSTVKEVLSRSTC
jgi:signal transduction histidine kinase